MLFQRNLATKMHKVNRTTLEAFSSEEISFDSYVKIMLVILFRNYTLDFVSFKKWQKQSTFNQNTKSKKSLIQTVTH